MTEIQDATDAFRKDLSSSTFVRAMVETGVRPFYRTMHMTGAGEAVVEGRDVVMAGCNDYLGLSTDPRVTAAAAEALTRYGASCSGARTLNGTLPLHGELEARIADFLGTEAAAVVTTGFQANLAVAAMIGRGDIVFSDMSNHASLVDGIRLGAGRRVLYPHSDTARLDTLLEQATAAEPTAGKILVTDGMFSMDGDLCRLPALAELAARHGARLVVDGAHDIGLLGPGGRGVAEHFGLMDRVDLFTGTLSKCFGSTGGFLAGPAHVIDYLRYSARSILFSASMPPAALAAGIAALGIAAAEPWRRRRVLALAEALRGGLRALGYDTGDSVTPVVPVLVGDATTCALMWQALLDEGVFTNAVGAPAVPEGRCVIRVTMQATHSDVHLERILDAFAAAGRRVGLVPELPAQAVTR
ncbi:pyridoxal phosphate-dependent aminotransferase family protein [Actinacidiphila glaucinigra]|uniref:aminotransferase class I/II-fold pyridoxal phosphate-dependent enzyme n=1 Tax=Actinacidiphila glaucinigra TaxID=235986 RepID=UPI0033BD2CF6